MSYTCFQDFIGMPLCSTEEPASGVYITDYPGISTELADKVASADQITFAGVWKSVQRQAYQKMLTDVQKAIRESANARIDQVLFQTQKPFVQQWQQIQTLAPDAVYRGVLASVSGTKYMGLRVKSFWVYNAGSNTVNVDVNIFQSQNAELVYTKNVDLAPGMNTVPVNQLFYSDFDKINLLLLVDCTNLETLGGNFIDWALLPYDIECATQWSLWNLNTVNMLPVEAPLNYGLGNTWTQQQQSGIYWDAELVCSLDLFVCSQRFNLLDAWARLLCSELLRFKLASQRVNYFTQSNREITERNQATFLQEYQDALSGWAQQLNLRGEGMCFNCEDSAVMGTRMRLP